MVSAKIFPKISIIMPTLNSQRTLDASLSSIKMQDYPGDYEIIIADGGSTDQTVKIAKKYGAKVYKNKLQTGEAGKAVGVRYANSELIALIDSDNVLPDEKWLRAMVQPLIADKQIIASEPLYFTYRNSDHWLTRYFALLGMGDPLNLFIGNYDRFSYITGKWTGLNLKFKDKGNYLEVDLRYEIPTIGANGFLIRAEQLKKYKNKDYLFDIDILKFLAKDNLIKIAKVKVGIVHLFTGDIATFARKQRRRVRDFMYFNKIGAREKYHSMDQMIIGIVKFTLATILVIPVVVQAIYGYHKKMDLAWFFHPIACFVTLYVYCTEIIRSIFIKKKLDRKSWRQ